MGLEDFPYFLFTIWLFDTVTTKGRLPEESEEYVTDGKGKHVLTETKDPSERSQRNIVS